MVMVTVQAVSSPWNGVHRFNGWVKTIADFCPVAV